MKKSPLLVPMFVNNVYGWGNDRGIHQHSTLVSQTLKMIEEIGELGGAIAGNQIDKIKDGIGDTYVTLVMVGAQLGASRDDLYQVLETINPVLALAIRPYSDAAPDKYWLFSSILGNARQILEIGIEEEAEHHIPELLNLIAKALDFLAPHFNLTNVECMDAAWAEIKDRKGRMVEGGTFIKDE